MIDFIYDYVEPCGISFVKLYFRIRDNSFLNTAANGGNLAEQIGNVFLTPCRFLFSGKKVTQIDLSKHACKATYAFQYNSHKVLEFLKTILAVISLLPGLIIGSAFKMAAFLSAKTRIRHQIVRQNLFKANIPTIQATRQHYEKQGINTKLEGEFVQEQPVQKPSLRDKGLTKTLKKTLRNQVKDIAALGEIFRHLMEANFLCWVDYGTLLGLYRHQGMIPWDRDIDLAILAPDHAQVEKLLREKLPSNKYQVMDFSPSSNRDSLLKVLVKETGMLIDLYHYQIHEETRTVTYIFSHANEFYIPEEAMKREIPHTQKHLSFDTLFPLKVAQFDGVQVLAPNHIEDYLMEKYTQKEKNGEELSREERMRQLQPCRIWDPEKKKYEKVPNHPYWEESNYNT